jgi:hypothetical protein
MNIRKTKIFLPVELYFIDHAGKTLQRFAITDNLPGLLDILQLVLDGSKNGLDDVAILDPARPGMIGNAARIAAHYGLRKRSFDEKLDNIRTWTIPETEG